MTFTHLEVHSHFTLLAATASIDELVARGRNDGLTHLALTDTNALYGAVAFARACRGAGIAPIIGMTVTVAPPEPYHLPAPGRGGVITGGKGGAGEGLAVSGRSTVGHRIGTDEEAAQLVLLAMNATGYRSLCRLSSLIQGSPDRERLAVRGLSWDDLAAHRAGLLCLSGGRAGWIERLLRGGDYAAAQRYAGRLAGLFDEDAYLALELQEAGDEVIAGEVAALGRRLGLATVAVQPVYCLSPADAPRLRLLAAIRTNARLPEADAATAEQMLTTWRQHVWLAPHEVASRFVHFPQAVELTGQLAARCSDCLPDGRPIWPALKLPVGQTPDEALAALAWSGLQSKYGLEAGSGGLEAGSWRLEAGSGGAGAESWRLEAGSGGAEAGSWKPETGSGGPEAGGRGRPAAAQPMPGREQSTSDIPARLERELAAIARHGYAPLFLVVADIVRYARSRDIPVSTRGSVANSLVAYCVGITTVDPIAHDLLFERFLNPARANPPDIDLDLCSRRRDEVLNYVRETYGPEHVALVGTVSTLRPQSAVRETGKAYGLPLPQIDRLVGLLPRGWHPDPRRRDQRTLDDVLAALDDPLEREVVRQAYTLIGQPDHLSVHPGGVVLTPGPLTDILPVQWAPKGFLITQFEHEDVEALGLPKIDLLGIRALTVLADAAEMVRRYHDPDFQLEHIPSHDAATAALIERGETIGVFQCESDGAQRTLRKLRARTVADLAIANAFFKPGPALGGMAAAFVRRYRGEEPTTFLHPALAPILGRTKGVLIFQEQVLRIAREVAGLTWEQADRLRRGMSHFGADEMAALRQQFVEGCQRPPPAGPGLTLAQAQTLWEQIMPFAGYGFNQGHATAYAEVSYRSAYLKAHWPAEFLCARLADWGGFNHPAVYIAEAVRLGIPVRPPHVNYSGEAFTLIYHESANQRISESANHESANHESANQRITNHESRNTKYGIRNTGHASSAVLYMGLGQVRDLRHSAVAAIIAARAAGPFIGPNDLLARADLQPKEIVHLVQCGALDGLGPSRAALLAEAEEYRRCGRPGQMAFEFPPPEVAPESAGQRLAWERHILGWPVSVHPLDLVRDRLPEHVPLRRLPEVPGRPVTVVGVRLPGWTGGPGFYLGDGDTFIIVRPPRSSAGPPSPWQPLVVRGRWIGDEWGTFWLEASEPIQKLQDLE